MWSRRTTPKSEPTPTSTESATTKVGGKGRPTPSRREAEAARKKRLAAPRTRREAAMQQRQRMREQRARTRAAMSGTGDERYLLPRDQGPVRGFVRDYVDSRYTIGQLMLPLFFAVFALFYVQAEWASRASSSLFLTVLVMLVLDSIRIRQGVRREIKRRFGADAARGTTFYALTRAWQMRRLRLPKPRVPIGADV